MTENTNTPNTPEDVAKAKTAARNEAEKRLRENHADEFRRLMTEEHERRGVEYTPRLTPAERARLEIERLAKEHGISVAMDIETIADAVVEEVEEEAPVPHSARISEALRLQAEATEVPEGTPVIDADARRAAAAATIFPQGNASY